MLEVKELQEYWIDKFNVEVVGKSLLPKWVLRQCRKYKGIESSGEDEDDDPRTENIFNEHLLKETEVGSSDENDQDGDPRAKRVETDFYQNIDEQVHLRCENEAALDEDEDLLNVINISNPRGYNLSLIHI